MDFKLNKAAFLLWVRHCFLSFLCLFFFLVPSGSGLFLCLGSDGHIALNFGAKETCCTEIEHDDDSHDDTLDHNEENEDSDTLNHDEENEEDFYCSSDNCVDIPFYLELISLVSKNPVPPQNEDFFVLFELPKNPPLETTEESPPFNISSRLLSQLDTIILQV